MANVVEETKKEFKKPYTNRRRYFGPLKVTNLTKEFKTFEEGFIEMSKHVPEIKSFCGETAMYQAVVGNILNVIRDNVPMLNSRQYPNTISFSINSHELGIRTDAGLAFGWRSRFNRDTDEVTYRFRVTYMNLSTPHKISINNLIEDGWEKKKDMVQSHFWDDVEQKRRKMNGDKSMKIDYNTDIGRKVAEADPTPEDVAEAKTANEVDKETKGEINEDIASQLAGLGVTAPAAELTATVEVEAEVKAEEASEITDEKKD
jgi:hypothetical protein